MSEILNSSIEKFHLKLDNGATMDFEGQNIAEVSWFEEEANSIIRQKMYTAQNGSQVYSISSGDGEKHSHKAYMLELQNDSLHMSNGKTSLEIEKDMFLLFVKSLLDKVEATSDTTIEHIEEMLRAANS